MKLALIRQRYNPFGGAERFVSSALHALARRDIKLTLITRKWDGATPGYDLLKCDPSYFGRLWRDYSFARCARIELDRNSFDLVQTHERIPGCDIFRAGDGVHAAWLEQRARVQGMMGSFANHLSPWHQYTLATERALFLHPNLKAVICISKLVRDDILRFYEVDPSKLHVIYNGINLDKYHPKLASEFRHPIRKQWNIPEDAPLFVYVGSGFERKGVTQLLSAAARVEAAYVLIVGNDKNLARFRAKVQRDGLASRVFFTGGVHDVRPYYAAADAFILPTLYEPLSNAVLEALASGLPSIVSSRCGAAELIAEGKNGYVCDALDISAITTGIAHLSRPGVAVSMRQSARDSVADLGLDAMSKRLVTLYENLL